MQITGIDDRISGCLLGLAVGDALGAPVEFQERDSFPLVTEMLGGGVFRLPPGAWTDDTAMALCLADSLIACDGYDPEDLKQRFFRWVEKGENTSTGQCVGIGQNTLRALGHLRSTGDVAAPANSKRSDGNGTIMRLAPVACKCWNDEQQAVQIAAAQSRLTHASDLAAAACELKAFVLVRLLNGQQWDCCRKAFVADHWPVEIKAIAAGSYERKSREEIKSTGYVADTLEAAFWAVHHTQSFEDALILTVNLGHDADTVGAVAGQLAGARYGMSCIPDRWLSVLSKKERLKRLSSEFVS